jgi:hypothetical protein
MEQHHGAAGGPKFLPIQYPSKAYSLREFGSMVSYRPLEATAHVCFIKNAGQLEFRDE